MVTNTSESATVSAPFAGALLEMGHRHPNLVVLCADLAHYTDVLPFAEAFPTRFIQCGMAEANMMGMAGGLAKTGLLPIAVTYGVFASRRSYDQVAMAMATGPSRGIVMGFLPGLVTPFRATHQALDDLALMREIPRMVVIDPADATEVSAALAAAIDHDGPVYMRGLRGTVARLFDPRGFTFRIGEARVLRQAGQVAIAATGLATQWALEAADHLGAEGISTAVLHVPTLKPLREDEPLSFLRRFHTVTTVENHSTLGGLATVLSELIARHGISTRIQALGVPDRWAPAGSLPYLRQQLGLDAGGIASMVRRQAA